MLQLSRIKQCSAMRVAIGPTWWEDKSSTYVGATSPSDRGEPIPIPREKGAGGEELAGDGGADLSVAHERDDVALYAGWELPFRQDLS
eukprot:12909639-Prorocentrum_lima.AAC.1